MRKPVSRGDVVLVRLDPARGREIRKTRPAVVASNSIACRHDAVVQVVPITALPDRPLRPYESAVTSVESGVTKTSRAVTNQIRTVDKDRLVRQLGNLSTEEISNLDRAIAIQLGLRRTT